ncbi:uncharacterized protein LOC9639588 [Selaginella moellendorffii]|uniref:uncharacterized protein LOC9639588 n=1 Tax=Selaginella moellendorffii TaxID=88036 RepID=UPI000D1C71DA|nr:uncharacterized protein LOC9639588 [Selaginella moellendorffii]XP_024521009.1 uncharacterized protein LOC9639588 [Selaginella moellendorffii]|eukprot:XP_002991474.2 uncharacterized protein LOC9639588 [Selaginella moellendorffii]
MALAISSGRGKAIQLQPVSHIAFVVRDAADSANVLLVRSIAAADLEPGDSEIWDLPCFDLPRLGKRQQLRGSIDHPQLVCSVEAALREAGVRNFAIEEAIEKVQALVPTPLHFVSLWKIVREPDFGPRAPIQTVVLIVEAPRYVSSLGSCEWFDPQRALELLVNETRDAERVGVLAASFFYPLFPKGTCSDLNLECFYQEYPPGVLVIPMLSRTLKPFCKTNLVISAPTSSRFLDADVNINDSTFTGQALIVDPGCSVPTYNELVAIVRLLPKKLFVFLTHHHLDHTEGLPAVKRANSEAIVIAHEKTLKRIGPALYGIKYVSVTGGTKLLISGQRFEIIAAPGHTDGHLCLFHLETRTLVAGDHCVGEGSSIVDGNSGGNLHDYMNTSHRLLELAPKVVVPMHGRPNLLPLQLLKGYIKHRQTREATILKAIEAGATSAFAIVSSAYKQTNILLWPAALINVKVHVDHLQRQQKLPQGFSVEKFKRSCGLAFKVRWFARFVGSYAFQRNAWRLLVCLAAIFFVWYKWGQGSGEEEEW